MASAAKANPTKPKVATITKPAGRLRRMGRWILRGLALLLALLVVFVVLGWTAFGHRAEGARLARMQRSPQWHEGGFENPQPMINDWGEMLLGALHASPDASPRTPLEVVPVTAAQLAASPPSGLRVTWLGHSTTLVELDGQRILTDPIWSERAGPYAVDVIVVSHDHYDHLDHRTVIALKDRPTTWVVPLGVGAHLAYWGVPEARIVELDWWERTRVGGLEIVCTPARHASGRALHDDGDKLWASFAFLGPRHRVYFSGDTGLFPALAEVGERLGPFDLTMIEIGQYDHAWPDWHVGPEQAVRAHRMVRGRAMLPIHWAPFTLAYHAWTEPVERALAEAEATKVTLLTPRLGQPVEPSSPPPRVRWWPKLAWRTAARDPIVSSQVPPDADAARR